MDVSAAEKYGVPRGAVAKNLSDAHGGGLPTELSEEVENQQKCVPAYCDGLIKQELLDLVQTYCTSVSLEDS
jgi:hypothetical protein